MFVKPYDLNRIMWITSQEFSPDLALMVEVAEIIIIKHPLDTKREKYKTIDSLSGGGDVK